VGPALPSPA